jgi:hypothetical protein
MVFGLLKDAEDLLNRSLKIRPKRCFAFPDVSS